MNQYLQREWLDKPFQNILAGIVVSLALIPEVIAFSVIAGVDPMVGLYASFIIAVTIAFTGGRSAMISAAAGAIALLVFPLVKTHGVDYLLAATILMGIIQVVFGMLKVGKLLKYIPNTVMMGFVDSLAILIFSSQLQHIFGLTGVTYIFAIVTIAIVYIVPRYFTKIPAPLIAVLLLTIISIMTNADVRTVGDLGEIKRTLPDFFIPNVPFNLETLLIILPYSLSMAVVGLVESLLTAKIVDDALENESDKNVESRGQGIANIVAGFFGGIGGCAMIGQSVMNLKSGGTTRLSSLVAGSFLMFLIIVLGHYVIQIPMSILAGIMVVVSFSTFDWGSFKFLRNAKVTDIIVVLVTIILVLATHNLAIGVIVGSIINFIFNRNDYLKQTKEV
ncbi:SulP family inorganic anion transporter [Macrococcoides bohemicum]|uniref:SulP family inorganic anion transporter n=1 Tax=Macrococcoides bohemicum TaxID=1903056 RepID=A0A328A881_9STAP|nr:SulP family inorganic anion transporter [Macrococcus bohemicus]QYA45101.1 SulP family inorganic anion transporter [Macrococcus bohemicus]RAK49658.1 sulfate permease [Macrococcus bohemicus]TDL36069.1 SulP family inorganic anion transporter [Macrococcus bohemicus]